MSLKLAFVALSTILVLGVDGQSAFNSFPPVNIDDLSPLTVSWNQVHYLIRENLVELEDIRREHEEIYKDLQNCYGLEKCLGEFNLLTANVETGSLSAGSLLSEIKRIQREREQLEGRTSQMEAELRERQRQMEYEQRQQQQQRQRQNYRGLSSASSSSSSSSSSSTSSQGSSYRGGMRTYGVSQGQGQGQDQGRDRMSSWERESSINRGGGGGDRSGWSTSYQRSYSYEYSSSGDKPVQQPTSDQSQARSSYEYERSYNYGYGKDDLDRRYGDDLGPIPGRG